MQYSRRTVLKGLGTLSVLGGGVSGGPAQAQHATLSTLVFISKRLDASTADYRKWYIEHHAPDFLSFGRPYLTRYTQDFVEKAHMGDVDFDCISEFQYRSPEARETLQRLVTEAEAQRILAAHPKIGAQPGPHEDHGGPRTFSVDERLVAGPKRAYDPPGTRKQAVLIRRKPGATEDAFAAALILFGFPVAQHADRVVLDHAVAEPDRPAPLFDAVMQVWPKGPGRVDIPGDPPAGIEIVNSLDLLSYESDLEKH
ncbi:MAG TPA: hypothetical protein VH722_14325 [Alphaproteobacteria bacterium]|jgi:hypothetical protein|nr:hypothetical protein [Alphaproteobacteria bacterium]